MTKKTQLFNYHKEQGKIVEFAGFEMPIWYKGIKEEYFAVRNNAGIFDVSHMGRTFIKGRESEDLLNYLTPNNASKLKPGMAHYSALCNEKGGIIDDIVLLRLEEHLFLLIFNADNREKDLDWINKKKKGFHVEIDHVSDRVAMIAIQGPKARIITQRVFDEDISSIGRFKCGYLTHNGIRCIASGTGYTGEDGLELSILKTTVDEPNNALKVWNTLLEEGNAEGLVPCGLGVRDVLRLEAGMCLYGNDIDESITPLEARISFIVKFDKPNFIGKEILFKQKQQGINRTRVGIKLLEQGIPRRGHDIIHDNTMIGKLTSGTYSPILKRGIAMGYVPTKFNDLGTKVKVRIRNRDVQSEISSMPFYDTTLYGWKRAKKE